MLRPQGPVGRAGRLTVCAHAAQQALRRQARDGHVDHALRRLRHTAHGGMIGLVLLRCNEQSVGVGVLCQQHHAERVAVEPADRVDGAGLPGPVIIAEQAVGQRAGLAGKRRMHEHALRLVDREQGLILIEDGKRPVLRGVIRPRLVEAHAHDVAGADGPVRVGRLAVDGVGAAVFQPPHERGRKLQLPPQDRQQARLPVRRAAKLHAQ